MAFWYLDDFHHDENTSTTSRDFLPPSPFFSPFSQVVCPVATFWLRIDILGISNNPHGKDHEAKARTTANGRQHPARVLLSAASVAFKTLLCAPFREVERYNTDNELSLRLLGMWWKRFWITWWWTRRPRRQRWRRWKKRRSDLTTPQVWRLPSLTCC